MCHGCEVGASPRQTVETEHHHHNPSPAYRRLDPGLASMTQQGRCPRMSLTHNLNHKGHSMKKRSNRSRTMNRSWLSKLVLLYRSIHTKGAQSNLYTRDRKRIRDFRNNQHPTSRQTDTASQHLQGLQTGPQYILRGQFG